MTLHPLHSEFRLSLYMTEGVTVNGQRLRCQGRRRPEGNDQRVKSVEGKGKRVKNRGQR
jgi:hypothetical protein